MQTHNNCGFRLILFELCNKSKHIHIKCFSVFCVELYNGNFVMSIVIMYYTIIIKFNNISPYDKSVIVELMVEWSIRDLCNCNYHVRQSMMESLNFNMLSYFYWNIVLLCLHFPFWMLPIFYELWSEWLIIKCIYIYLLWFSSKPFFSKDWPRFPKINVI